MVRFSAGHNSEMRQFNSLIVTLIRAQCKCLSVLFGASLFMKVLKLCKASRHVRITVGAF